MIYIYIYINAKFSYLYTQRVKIHKFQQLPRVSVDTIKNQHHHKSTCNILASSFFVWQHSNCLFTHGARGRLHVSAGFRALTVKFDLLCFSGTHFFFHPYLPDCFVTARLEAFLCACQTAYVLVAGVSQAVPSTASPHTPRCRELAAPFVAVIASPPPPTAPHTPCRRPHTGLLACAGLDERL